MSDKPLGGANTTSKRIRVMIVDDSPVMREVIADSIAKDPGMEVVGTAGDGQEALKNLDRCNPDVITLDVQMPRMGGLETLDALLTRRAIPIIMVSSMTRLGANITLEALERGAIDYVAKPDGVRDAQTAMGELVRKINSVAFTDLAHVLETRRRMAERRKLRQAGVAGTGTPATRLTVGPGGISLEQPLQLEDKLIAIGISTGGPPALASLFESLKGPLPPIVIVQHMPPHFTKAFANRLNTLSKISVKEAETGDVLQPNCAYIAEGGKHLRIVRTGIASIVGKLQVFEDEPVSGHRPSADVMMNSAAELYRDRCLGLIMTGMGRDGSDGCKAIRARGGYVLGQDEASSDVYGMNKVAMLEGNVDRQFGLDDAAVTLMQQVRRQWTPVRAMAGV